MLTDKLPRIALGQFPTPIEELLRLSRALGGSRLFVKRDDQTGLAGGGNKTRKLEFSVAEALARGCDTLVTMGGVQSNHCRQTAAAAAKVGLRCVVVLRGDPPASWNGNLLLNSILGAEVVFSRDKTREEKTEEILESERRAGRKPLLIPVGASDEFGAVGYVAAMEELDAQLKMRNLPIDRVVVASGSFGTQAGMVVGAKALSLKPAITAIAIDSSKQELQKSVALLADRISDRLGLGLRFAAEEIDAYDDYLGGGYAVMGEPEKEAIELAGRTEGLLLDPVYSGRAMAGLIDLIRKGVFGKDETILFWHTGGSAALFAYADQLMEDRR